MGYLSRHDMDDMDSGDMISLAGELGIDVSHCTKRTEIMKVLLKEAPAVKPNMTREEAITHLADDETWTEEEAAEFVDAVISGVKKGTIK